MKTWCDIIGWAGMATLLTIYLLISLKMLQFGGLYFSLNSLSGLCLVVHGWERRAWPVVVANAIFSAIGAVGLVRLLI